MYFVYILESEKISRYYVGYTNNISNRLSHHNSGANRSTRPFRLWKIVYKEEFSDKRSAWLRERQLKSYKKGEAFKKLIHGCVA